MIEGRMKEGPSAWRTQGNARIPLIETVGAAYSSSPCTMFRQSSATCKRLPDMLVYELRGVLSMI